MTRYFGAAKKPSYMKIVEQTLFSAGFINKQVSSQ